MECQPSPPPPYHSLVANSLETSKYATFSSPNQCPGMIPQCTLFSHDFPASLCLQSPSLDQRLGNSVWLCVSMPAHVLFSGFVVEL